MILYILDVKKKRYGYIRATRERERERERRRRRRRHAIAGATSAAAAAAEQSTAECSSSVPWTIDLSIARASCIQTAFRVY